MPSPTLSLIFRLVTFLPRATTLPTPSCPPTLLICVSFSSTNESSQLFLLSSHLLLIHSKMVDTTYWWDTVVVVVVCKSLGKSVWEWEKWVKNLVEASGIVFAWERIDVRGTDSASGDLDFDFVVPERRQSHRQLNDGSTWSLDTPGRFDDDETTTLTSTFKTSSATSKTSTTTSATTR